MDKKKSIENKEEVINLLKRNLVSIKNFGIRKIGLFGSIARGDSKPESDIDILIEFEEDSEKFSNLINLYFFLQELLGRKVELVTTRGISPYIAPHILREVEYIEGLS